MACPVAYNNPTRMTRAAFAAICQMKRREKINGWASAKNYEPLYPQCAACVTGRLIADGQDFLAPANVELLETVQTLKQKEMLMKEDEKTINDGPFKTMPEVTDHLRLTDLRECWRRTPAQDNTIGTCVNCARPDQKIRSAGLCSSCQSATTKKRGETLLAGLAEARVRLWSDDSLRRASVQKNRKKRKPKPAAAARTAAAIPSSAPKIKQTAAAPPVAPDPGATALYRIGQQYKLLGEKLMDQTATINELTAAAARLGLKIDINIVTKEVA